MKGWCVMAVLLALLVGGCGEEIDGSNASALREGCWLVRFYASWCTACKSTADDWTDASQEKSLRFGCRFAEIDVDQNIALAEAYGVRSIPSYFVLAEEGVCKLDKPFSVSVFVDFVQSCRAGETERAQGVLRDPRSPLWALVVRLGYLVQSAHAAMTAQGLSHNQQIAAAVVGGSAFLLIWGFGVFLLLSLLGSLCVRSAEPKQKKE